MREIASPEPDLGPFGQSDEPIREDLLSTERLEQYAESIASQSILPSDLPGRWLAPRVRDNGRVLLQCYRTLAEVIREESARTPAAEWFVDNFHIVDDALREIREDLPRGFYRQLPKLADGPLSGYPRVLGLAWGFVAHTDSRFEPEILRRYIGGFQRVEPLTIGELWAVPIVLRILLLENLRRLAGRIVKARTARRDADSLANDLLGVGGRPARSTAFERLEAAAVQSAFAVQLVQRLREQDPETTPAWRWLNERLAARGTTPDEIVRVEHQRQAATNVTVRNIITSLRLMSTFDWTAFFESVSLVDELLRASDGFAAMDFATRDRYRHAIEDLARGSGRSELDVTRAALAWAHRAGRGSGAAPGDRSRDPGYYLISKGRTAFEADLGYRLPARRWLLRAYVAAATPSYLGSIALVTAFLLAVPLHAALASGMAPLLAALLGLVALFPASDLALALVNRAVMELFGPRPLPRLELRDGVPPSLRTLIVVPTLLTSEADIDEQISRLEIHYLANADGDIRLALLSDHVDAPAETMPEDAALMAAAAEGIAWLNRRHGPAPDGGDRFFVLHRRRVWNSAEGKWMGWERKRGKLHELNRLLRGASDTTFVPIAGRRPAVPTDVRFVITLDADTRLPRGAATRLVGLMAHPLNRPSFDVEAGRVVDGYAVLQPRITPTMPTDREGSLFQRIFAGPAGIDPYAAAVSDVYQDLFGEGSYTGKGIYDVDAFEAALAGRVPENSLLSHDLFEGIFARAGLVTDLELFEEFPSHYESAVVRQHRWARGDWQLLPWIFGRGSGGGRRAGIPLIGRWKMLDNLRRTLSAPGAWLTLVASWTLPQGAPFRVDETRARRHRDTRPDPRASRRFSRRARAFPSAVTFARSSRVAAVAGAQIALGITFLAHQAWLMSAAVAQTLFRVYVSRRRLARVDHRRHRPGRPCPSIWPDSTEGCAARSCWPRWRRRWSSCSARELDHRRAVRPALECVPDRGSMDQPSGARPIDVAGVAGRRPGSCARPGGARGGSSRRSSVQPTISCRPTTSRRIRSRSSRTARLPPTSACTSCRRWALATSAGRAPSRLSNGSRRRWPRWDVSSASEVTSTTGMRPTPSGRSSLATSRRWTAGISRAICSWSGTPAGRHPGGSCWVPRPWRGSETSCGSSRRPREVWATTVAR